MKKKYIVIAIVVVVALVAVFWGRNKVNSPTASLNGDCLPNNDCIADWQTYKNEQYGFEFQYPKDWSICKKTSDVQYVIISDNCSNSDQNPFSDPSNYFMVRTIGDLDLGYLQSGSLKSDTGWQDWTDKASGTSLGVMRAIYYQSQNINLVLKRSDSPGKKATSDILDQIKVTFKFTK